MTASRKLQLGLAGAAAMAAGSQAYGVVVFVPTPADLPAPAPGTASVTRTWDVDQNGSNDFTFVFRYPNTTGATGVVWQTNMNPPAGGNAVGGHPGTFITYGTNFVQNTLIGATLPTGSSFQTSAQVTLGSVYRSGGVPFAYGGFGNGAPPGAPPPGGQHNPGGGQPQNAEGFVGFRLGSGANARYGWLQLRTNTTFGIDFIAAALGDPGETVETGVIPEPASLGMLAIGAAAMLRRKR